MCECECLCDDTVVAEMLSLMMLIITTTTTTRTERGRIHSFVCLLARMCAVSVCEFDE